MVAEYSHSAPWSLYVLGWWRTRHTAGVVAGTGNDFLSDHALDCQIFFSSHDYHFDGALYWCIPGCIRRTYWLWLVRIPPASGDVVYFYYRGAVPPKRGDLSHLHKNYFFIVWGIASSGLPNYVFISTSVQQRSFVRYSDWHSGDWCFKERTIFHDRWVFWKFKLWCFSEPFYCFVDDW